MTMRILVAIPAKDEELTIGTVVALSKQYGDVLVVDDGSEDETAKVAELSGAKVLRHELNLGKAEALRSVFKYAIENGYDVAVCLDADGQHDPCDIPKLLEPIIEDEADLVIGSRFLRKNVPKYRIFGQKVLDVLTNFASEAKITDSQSGFRALNRKALKHIKDFRSEGYSMEFEFHYTPKKASWLNMIEIESSALSKQCLDRRIGDIKALRGGKLGQEIRMQS